MTETVINRMFGRASKSFVKELKTFDIAEVNRNTE